MAGPDLFSPAELGDIALSNRVIMAPMTRSRARADGVPTPEMADYYGQRAGAGLIISEGIQPNADGQGYCRTPGLHSPEQETAWRNITEAVNEQDGKIVAQLMHVGRISSAANKGDGARTLAPSALQARGEMYTDTAGMQPFDVPVEMTISDITRTIDDYADAASMAVRAGFSGVELHATSGYLPAQFLSTGTNQRTDNYGGSLNRRLKFVVSLIDALIASVGSGRVGLRICPGNRFNDLRDDDPEETFTALLRAVDPKQLAYLHVIRMPATGLDNFEIARANFSGPLIFNDSFSQQEANSFIARGDCTAVSFGRAFVANPDLVSRFKTGRELATLDAKRLYTPGPQGYSDYPSLSADKV